ncbi:MAG TPA: universal stress protein [Chitinophagales bacterium]|nr:universal stress protein [Chitinophagales bacterium]
MYRILTLTDFSENSKSALEFSKILALKSDCVANILHTIAPVKGSITLSDQSVELNNILFEDAIEKMDEIVSDFNAVDISPNAMIRSGVLIQVLEEIIQEFNIDLLLITSYGYGNPTRKLVGKNAAFILANIHTPTIIVPSLHEVTDINKVNFVHQLTKPKLNHLYDAFNFLKLFNINELDIVHILSEEQDVYKADKSMIQNTQKAFPDKTINFDFIEGEFVVNRLYHFLKEYQTDFLVISSNKKNFWKRFVSGNIHVDADAKIIVPIFVLSDALV